MSDEMNKTCCFTGHRPQNLPFGFNEQHAGCITIKSKIKDRIIRLVEENGVEHFISGMALGVDTWAAEAVLELKNLYPHITLEAAIPCLSQSSRWSFDAKKRYDDICGKCDKVTVIGQNYTPYCMHNRNRYMIDNSAYVIAVWNGKSGGTGKTVHYAIENGKEILVINPFGQE